MDEEVVAVHGNSRENGPEKSGFRFLFFTVFCVGLVTINLSGFGFASIANSAADYYDVHVNLINMLTMVTFAVGGLFYFLAMFVTDAYPCFVGFSIAMVLGFTGACVRCIHSFTYCVIGQVLCAMATPFLNSAPAALGKEFFQPNERALITAAGTLSQLIGMGAGLAISPAFEEDVGRWVEVQATLIAVPAAFVVPFYCIHRYQRHNSEDKEQRKTFRQAAASFLTTCKVLLTNRNFLRLLVGFSIVTGVINALISLIDQVGPDSIIVDHSLGGLTAGLFFACGAVGAIVISIIVDYSRNYRYILRCLTVVLIPVWIFTFVGWMLDYHYSFILVGMSLLGFLGIPLFPLSIEYGVELCFDHETNVEGAVNGLIQNTQNVFGVIITIISTPNLLFDMSKDDVPIIWGCLCFVGLLLMISGEEDYRRLRHEASSSYLALL